MVGGGAAVLNLLSVGTIKILPSSGVFVVTCIYGSSVSQELLSLGGSHDDC